MLARCNAYAARLALLLAVALTLLPYRAVDAADRQNSTLRPSSEDLRLSLPLLERLNSAASGSKRPSAAKPEPKPPEPVSPPPVQPTPTPTPPKPAVQPPKPEPPKPPEKPRSSDPVQRMREDLQEARKKLEADRALDAFRDAARIVAQINGRKLAENGLDGKGARAEEFRDARAEALQLAREAGNFMTKKPSNAFKPLKFYF